MQGYNALCCITFGISIFYDQFKVKEEKICFIEKWDKSLTCESKEMQKKKVKCVDKN